ncbi:MAG TPA: low affinity iron permease family protein [Dehalococcoidia bacterium]|jgi:low affinity Fe/Cu permease|nr:low affinity iron permease family protein [Dehalococcoidia bacterium]
MGEAFRKFAQTTSDLVGSVWAFALAAAIIIAWAITGPVFAFSDTWQLIINTGTTIVTFLMVFLIQNTQNRDNKALQTKLDELIINMVGADNRLVLAEDLSDEQLAHLKDHFEKIANGKKRSRGRAQTAARKR